MDVLGTYTEPICSGNTPGTIIGALPNGGNGSFIYLWESSTTSSSSGFASATGTNNTQNYTPGSLAQTTWYRRTVTSGGCSNTATAIQITVNPLPVAAGTITGTATVCQGQAAVAYSVPAITNATSYTWAYSGTGAIVSGPTASMTITFAANATAGNLTVRGTNACGNGTVSANYAITVNPLPIAAGTITGTATVCQGQAAVAYSVPAITNATSYTWAYSGTGATVSGPTASMTITFAANATSGNLTVQGTNACGNGTTSANYGITVNQLPTITGQPASPAAVCSGTNSSTFTVTATGAVLTYQWQRGIAGAYTNITGAGVPADGCTYSNYTTATLTVTNAPSGMNGYTYRCVVSGTCTPAVTSNGAATLTVNALPAITSATAGASPICANATTTLTANGVGGAGATVTWWSGTGGTGTNFGTGLTLANAVPGTYYARVTGTCTPAVEAIVTVAATTIPAITGQPASPAAVCAGANSSTFTVAATGAGLTYQWQRGITGVYTNITGAGVPADGCTYSNYTTATLTVTNAPSGMNGFTYRCVVSGTCTPAVTSNGAATLTVNTAPAITGQPASPAAVCSGTNSSTFTVAATGTGLNYQWQRGIAGVYTNITGGTTPNDGCTYSGYTGATLTITNALSGMNGYTYQCVVSGTCTPSATSNGSATLTFSTAPVITGQPASPTAVCSGTNASTFTVAATGTGLTYQWQRGISGAYANITAGTTPNDGCTYSGYTGVTLTVTNATSGMNGYTYRCVISSGACSSTSNGNATLTVNTAPAITGQPASPATVIAGTNSSTFTITATGLGLTYQWQRGIAGTYTSITAGTTPNDGCTYSGYTGVTLTVTNAPLGMNGYTYRCVVSGTCTPSVTSDGAATLTVTSSSCITTQPSNVTICSGVNTSFSIVATGSPTYHWQVSTNGGGTYTDITAAGTDPVYSNYTTATLGIAPTNPAMNGYKYRCRLTGGCAQISNAATLTLQIINITYKLSASPDLVETTGSINLNSTLTLSGSQTGVNYQLRDGTNGNALIGSPVTGTGGSISFAPVTPIHSTQYNVLATTATGGCSAQITDTKGITVNETGIIISLTTCNGQPGLNFFTNSDFGTTTTNNYQTPDQLLFPGVILGHPLGAYTNYTYGFVSNAIPDGNYVIANSTAGMYRTPQQVMSRDVWLFTYDRSSTPGTGDMYIVNASNAPGIFYTEILSNLCENTRYEFRSEMINLYDANWVPHGPDYLNYFPSDGQGNYYSILPNVDFMLNGKVALNTGNIMNDAAWKTFGFTFRTATGQNSVTLTMRNNSTGGIGNDIALDNIIMRACGPEISLIINTTLPVCPGIPVTMTAHLIASDYLTPEFQWQKSTDNGVTWNNISGANDSIYTSTNPAYGDKFRFLVAETTASLGNPNCSVASNPVSITTTAGITGTTPGSVCGTGTVTLGATANSGSTINWYANLTGGTSLGTGTSYTTPTISTTTTYYVEATNGGCMSNPRTSVVATVNTIVAASISISASTGNSICSGTNVTFTATPTNGGATPSYQWKLNGGNVGTNIATYSNNTLTNGNTISCVMTSSISGCITGSPATSNTITMTVGTSMPASVSISANPGNSICQGTSVTFTAVATNGGATPNYQWKKNTIDIYGEVSNVYTTTTLVQGDIIICVMTTSLACATGSPATSNSITMTVNTNLPASVSIAAVPSGAICTGTSVTFTATPTNGGTTPTYQWYNGASPIGGATNLTYTSTTLTNGAAITVHMISNATCATGSPATSNTVTMIVDPTSVGGTVTSDQTICSGTSPADLHLSGNTGTVVKWQKSTDAGFSSPTDIAVTSTTLSGATIGNLTVNTYFRAVVQSGVCSSANSASVLITITPTVGTPTAITVSAGSEPTCQLTNGTTTTTYTTTATNNTGFNWSLSNGSAGSIGITTGIMTWADGFSGTVNIQVTASGCNGPSSQVTRTVNITPTVGTPTAITVSAGTEPTCQLTNGTTTTTYATTATNNTGFNWSLSNGSAGSIDATTGVMTWADGFSGSVNIQVTASGCNGPSSQVIRTVTITPSIGTPTAITISAGTEPTCQLTNGTTTTTYATTAANSTGFNWSLSNGAAGSIGATTGIMTWANGFSGTVDIQVTASGCNGPSAQVTRTVNITPTVGTPTAITVSAGTEPTCQLTNGTTTTTYATTATNNTGYNWSLSNGSAGSIGATTGVMTWANGFTGSVNIQVTASGCNGPSVQVIRTVNVNPLPTASAGGSQAICSNATATVSGATSSNGTILWTHNGAGSITAGSTTLTPTYTAAAGDASHAVTLTMTVTSNNACSPQTATATYTVDVNPLPTATAGGTQTICSNITATVSGASSSNGTILWTHNGAGSLSNATTLTPTYTPVVGDGGNTVTLTMTVTSTIACASPITATATYTVNVNLEGSWSGNYITDNTDWNKTENWDCNQLPSLTSDVIIATGVTNNHPVLSSGSDGTCRNLTIQSGASMTVSGNTLQIAGTITNDGTFTATNGTIEMKGSSAQTIPANTFSTNTLLNLTVNNAAGVAIGGPLNITGILKAETGNLSSGGNLTLVSTAAQTALIDGSGTGQVLGNVAMQRYLPSAFGYKYFSSPFQGATVNEFADDLDLTATFPTFYRYDEDNHIDTSGVPVYESGWVKYITPTDPLVPMQGYAANFGSVSAPKTADITGVVNNGSFPPLSLMNHNRTHTQGFNLVGNPYPSPIDWDASSGWTRLNIDNAIYYFNAGVTSEYTGSYSSYINGVSTGIASNIIPAMQSFFVHVSDGSYSYPQTGALTFTNPVRINTLNPVFHKFTSEEIPLLRFTAGFEDSPENEDAMVIYFNDAASWKFDKEYDALKLMNTDWQVPNIYSVSSDASKLSVNALPTLVDSINVIPVGLKTEKDGWISFHAREIKNFPTNLYIYFSDSRSGMCQNLLLNKDARINLKSGLYENRFSLIFSLKDFQYKPGADENFYAYSFEGTLYVYLKLEPGEKGTLSLYNILGQPVYHSDLFINGFQQIKTDLKPGIYVISLSSSKGIYLKKVFISNL